MFIKHKVTVWKPVTVPLKQWFNNPKAALHLAVFQEMTVGFFSMESKKDNLLKHVHVNFGSQTGSPALPLLLKCRESTVFLKAVNSCIAKLNYLAEKTGKVWAYTPKKTETNPAVAKLLFSGNKTQLTPSFLSQCLIKRKEQRLEQFKSLRGFPLVPH